MEPGRRNRRDRLHHERRTVEADHSAVRRHRDRSEGAVPDEISVGHVPAILNRDDPPPPRRGGHLHSDLVGEQDRHVRRHLRQGPELAPHDERLR